MGNNAKHTLCLSYLLPPPPPPHVLLRAALSSTWFFFVLSWLPGLLPCLYLMSQPTHSVPDCVDRGGSVSHPKALRTGCDVDLHIASIVVYLLAGRVCPRAASDLYVFFCNQLTLSWDIIPL